MNHLRLWRIPLLAVAAMALSAPGGAEAARPLNLGFFAEGISLADPGTRDPLLDRAGAVGAQVLRVLAGWPAATRPADPRDPSDPAYDFTAADAAVTAATAHGFRVLVSFTGAPPWAEGPGRPTGAIPGTWKPDPKAVGDYGAALARRYDGAYPDPAHPGATLPRVTDFQVWNEPNLSSFLTPQWSGSRPVAALRYRAMLNAFYSGVKAVQPSALVITAGSAPFGEFGHGTRTMPVPFWTTVLRSRTNFDVLDHHPYSISGPTHHALNAGDVSIPDIGKLSRVLRQAAVRGTILGHKRLWVTEVSYDSGPPDPRGVPLAIHARWLEQALYILWRQGVDTVLWFQVDDQPPDPSYEASYQSGVYFQGGQAKPAATAYRFPLVVAKGLAWTRPPASGTLSLQVKSTATAAWKTVRTRHVDARQVVQLAFHHKRGARVRAVVGADHSLPWRVG